tara:strand:- start:31 stop:417 length:387 start_codon:yes stop_codon:yes gene_type:complete
MASTLKINTLTGVSTAGSIAVTGEGGSTTTNLQQGLAKMWANVDGTGTAAIDDSLNTSGFTDNGTGDYSVEIANDFSTSNHSVQLNGNSAHVGITSVATGSVRVFVTSSSNSAQDVDPTTFASFGDLA